MAALNVSGLNSVLPLEVGSERSLIAGFGFQTGLVHLIASPTNPSIRHRKPPRSPTSGPAWEYRENRGDNEGHAPRP